MKAKSTNRFLYNPARMPEDEFLARFIVREKQFRLLWEEISASRLDMIDQHFLIVGQRGMGKTSLMLKTAYEIGRNQELKDWLIPILFPEELFGVAELLDLWLALGELLEDQFPGLSKELKSSAEQNSEHKLIEAIRQRLTDSKKKLVLFIDNFGDLLDRLDDNEVRRLREILMTATDIRLVAASARVMDHTYRYDKPFFDFFNTIYLPGLDKAESMKLMQGLADNAGKRADFDELLAKHPARVEAIRRLTGGVPRLLLLLFSSLMEGGETEVMEDLESILDQVSPYYKHRVEDLQSQQRSIFHQVSMAWDAVSTKEIAAATRLESKKVSAQLQQMVDNDILERVETGTKNHLYRLKERFFNIWYLMRMAGSKGAIRMRWLISFLEAWLEGPELNSKLQKFVHQLTEAGNFAAAKGIEELMGALLYMPTHLEEDKKAPATQASGKTTSFHEDTFRCEEPSAEYNMTDDEIQLALLHLWNSEFQLAKDNAAAYFQKQVPNNHNFAYYQLYLTTLLIRHQIHECASIFENSPFQLKEVFKPLWFALMKLMGDDGRKGQLRMGPELQETVDEIVEFVLRMRTKHPS